MKSKFKYLITILNIMFFLFLCNSNFSFAGEATGRKKNERMPVSSESSGDAEDSVDNKNALISNAEQKQSDEDKDEDKDTSEDPHISVTKKSNVHVDKFGRNVSWDEERYDSAAPDKKVTVHVKVEYDKNNPNKVIHYFEEGDETGPPSEGAPEGLNNHYTLERTYHSFNGLGQVTSYSEEYNGEDEHRTSEITNIVYDENGQRFSYHEEGTNKDGSYSFDRKNMKYKAGNLIEYNESGVDTDGNKYDSHTYGIMYNSEGQRTRYISDTTSTGTNTDTSKDGSSTTTTTSTSTSHSVVTDMRYNALGQMISYEGSSTFSSTGQSTTTYKGYPGRKTVSDYTSSGSSQTNWKATYDEHGTQTECGTKSSQSHTTGTSVTTDEATPDLVITSEFSRDYVNGQMTYSYETVHSSATPDLTTTVERTDISYNKESTYNWEDNEWDSGLSTSYTEVTHQFGSYTDEEGNVHQIDKTTTTKRLSTTYNALEQVTGYVEEITTIDNTDPTAQPIITRIEMSDMVYDDSGRVISYVQKVTDEEGVTTTITRLNTQYNSWGQVIGYDEDQVNSVAPGVITHIHKEEIKYNSFGQLIQSLEIRRDSSSDVMTIIITLGTKYNSLGQVIDSSVVNNLRGDLSYQEALKYGRNVYRALNDERLRSAAESYYGSFNIYGDMTALIDGARYVADIMAENDGMSFEDALKIAIEQIGEWHNED